MLIGLFVAFYAKAKNNRKPVPYVSELTEEEMQYKKQIDKAVGGAMTAMGLPHWYWDNDSINTVVASEQDGPRKGWPVRYKITFARKDKDAIIVESILGENMKNPFIVTKPEPTIEEATSYFTNILDNDCSIITAINERIYDAGFIEVHGMAINSNVKLTKNQIKGLKQAFLDKGYDILNVDYDMGIYTLAFVNDDVCTE